MECEIRIKFESGGNNSEEIIEFKVNNSSYSDAKDRMEKMIKDEIYPIIHSPDIEEAIIVIKK